MTILETLSKLAQPVARPNSSAAKKDPVMARRLKFSAVADEQIKQIKAAAEKGRWFAKQSDEGYVVSLRNGNKVVAIGENTHFAVTNAANAVKFIETVNKAAQAGELDKHLQETAFQRKSKEKKPEQPQPEKQAEPKK